MIKKMKMQYSKSREVNGIIYKGAKVSLASTELAKMGIDEDNPFINVEYDQSKKKITISPAKF